ncbi:MAG: hypothetical protein JWO24_2948 [Rhodospirillales bacterium]|nr:hypothetical protein [Rhodospirillales bacterium]
MNTPIKVPLLGIHIVPAVLLADLLQWFLRGLVVSGAWRLVTA